MDDAVFQIEEELKKLPAGPGVYLMHDSRDTIIYVGKAISLKNRVRQYFQSSRNLSPKIASMVSKIARFEYIVTDSELEALVLECNLIKEYRPKYNTMLKDDKTYPYIKVTVNEEYPRIFMTRRLQRDGAKYFGPYTSAYAVRDTIELLRKIYKIRSCRRNLPADIGKDRPCLYAQIGQCDAPCQGAVTAAVYRENIQGALRFLSGSYREVTDLLQTRMQEASKELDFEKAAIYRDLLLSVNQIAQKQRASGSPTDERDVIAYAQNEDEAVVQVFFIRDGKLIGREHFYLTGVGNETPSAILTAFVKQYYASAPFIPVNLLLQAPIEEQELVLEWLSARRGQKVTLTVPKKGQKERLIELAAENAQMVLQKDREKIRRAQERTTGAVGELTQMLGLPYAKRIEAYDISNISGYENVGSMIVFEDGKPKKNAYRKFRIRWFKGQDDYRSMQEVLTRRFTHGLKEKEELEQKGMDVDLGAFSAFPDLIMMDGGKGQVNIALAVLDELELSIPVCGMVKDEHHNTRGLYYQNEEIPIYTRQEAFALITRIQDEAHRFAIEYHRSLRGKEQVHSILDDIEGIGPARRKALLRSFQDIANIEKASVEELEAVDTMNHKAAQNVYQFFH